MVSFALLVLSLFCCPAGTLASHACALFGVSTRRGGGRELMHVHWNSCKTFRSRASVGLCITQNGP
jgi:hypothetical protein